MSPLDLRKIVVDAMQEILVPDLQEIKHRISILEMEIKNLDTKFLTLEAKLSSFREEFNTKLTSFREEFKSEIRRLDEKIDSLGIQLNQRISSLEEKMDQRMDSMERQIQTNREDYKLAVNLHERIAALEARFSAN